jgi:hypothetical protein
MLEWYAASLRSPIALTAVSQFVQIVDPNVAAIRSVNFATTTM